MDDHNDDLASRLEEEFPELMRYKQAIKEIAELVGAQHDDPVGVVFFVREKLREGARWTSRMRDLEQRIANAKLFLEGKAGK